MPGDSGYSPFRPWSTRTGVPRPGVIVRPARESDVAAAVLFAARHHMRVAAVSTGHNQDSRNVADNAVLLDMRGMASCAVDEAGRSVTVGPGQPFSAIHACVDRDTGGRLVAASGADPGVGPAGWALGGGHGRLTRLHGLGADVLESLRVVLADGSAVTADAHTNTDLFRVLRGGASQAWGVVTSLTFRLFDAPPGVSQFLGFFNASDATADLLGGWLARAPDTSSIYYVCASTNTPLPDC